MDTTNPAVEAEALKAKTPPPLPSGSILGGSAAPHPAPPLGVTADQAKNAATVLVTNPASVQTALDAIAAAETAIKGAGNVTGDLSLAMTGCATATKWLNAALAKANAAAPKA
jgi:hypothetical protein